MANILCSGLAVEVAALRQYHAMHMLTSSDQCYHFPAFTALHPFLCVPMLSQA